MAKQGTNIYRRKDGRWEGKYVKERSDGKIRYGYISGNSYEDVLEKKQKKLRELERKNERGQSEPLSVSETADRWLASRYGILKETTRGKYASILKNYIIPEYGDRLVHDITRNEVRLWLETLLKPEGGNRDGMSAKSVNGIASVLRLVFRYAGTECNVTAPDIGNLYIKQAKNRVQILSGSEQELLEEYLMEHMDFVSLGIITCLYTGIRLGEVCALQWGNVKQEDGILDIHSTMSRIKTEDDNSQKTKIVITPPKSDCSVRKIPIPADLLAIMKTMRCADDSFFLTGSKADYMDPRTLQYRFRNVLEKCGIRPVRFHALRHTFATKCIELDFDVKSLSEILGHANVAITMNRYVHPTMVMKKDYMDRLSLISDRSSAHT